MIYKKVEIKVEGYQEIADLYTYILDNSVEMRPNRKRPVIVICPGGGYTMTSDREAEPIAMQYLARGYHAVILRYSVAPVRYPLALLQLAKSVAYLREHAEEFHIDTAKIILQGFSAGAHLAASLGVFWKEQFIRSFPPENLHIRGLLRHCLELTAVILKKEKSSRWNFR